MLEVYQHELAELKANPAPGFDKTHALCESGDKDMHVAIRGNLRKTGELAPRRFLRILAGPNPAPFTEGSGRKQLAEAVVARDNPLTARVFVNRVWMHHFGDGIVRTPSNFGSLGEKPTHPQLLDWLTSEFVDTGWSLKRLHRMIMTSVTYQQSSEYNAAAFQRDGDNRFLWRFTPRRMDVEVWRDSLLAVTGELDSTRGGPSRTDITKNRRRTIYAKVSRNGDVFESDLFLRRFDFPLMRATVAKRPKSIVPQQYLFLLNSTFMVDRAKSLVSRLERETTADSAAQLPKRQISRAYQLLYGRLPVDEELQLGLSFVRQVGTENGELSPWQQYAQTLLSSNEFMFVR